MIIEKEYKIIPNIITNRFDYSGDKFCLIKIDEIYVQIKIEKRVCLVGLYLRKLTENQLNLLVNFIFNKFCNVDEIRFLHTYTNLPNISEQKRTEMIGNGWTVDIISHIFSYMEEAKNGN